MFKHDINQWEADFIDTFGEWLEAQFGVKDLIVKDVSLKEFILHYLELAKQYQKGQCKNTLERLKYKKRIGGIILKEVEFNQKIQKELDKL